MPRPKPICIHLNHTTASGIFLGSNDNRLAFTSPAMTSGSESRDPDPYDPAEDIPSVTVYDGAFDYWVNKTHPDTWNFCAESLEYDCTITLYLSHLYLENSNGDYYDWNGGEIDKTTSSMDVRINDGCVISPGASIGQDDFIDAWDSEYSFEFNNCECEFEARLPEGFVWQSTGNRFRYITLT